MKLSPSDSLIATAGILSSWFLAVFVVGIFMTVLVFAVENHSELASSFWFEAAYAIAAGGAAIGPLVWLIFRVRKGAPPFVWGFFAGLVALYLLMAIGILGGLAGSCQQT